MNSETSPSLSLGLFGRLDWMRGFQIEASCLRLKVENGKTTYVTSHTHFCLLTSLHLRGELLGTPSIQIYCPFFIMCVILKLLVSFNLQCFYDFENLINGFSQQDLSIRSIFHI